MTAFVDKQIKVHLEQPDGLVFVGKCLMTTININQNELEITSFGDSSRLFRPNGLSWDINLQGIGSPTWKQGGDLAPAIASRFLPQEWACEMCGRANHLKYQQCQSCGWYRGLFVDVAEEAGVWRVRR